MLGIGEEVKYCAVVPEVPLAAWDEFHDVLLQPLHLVAICSDALSRRPQCFVRHIQDREVAIPPFQEEIDDP